jgi:hypothetical protein
MSKEVGRLPDIRPASRASCLGLNKQPDRYRSTKFRMPRRDRLPRSPMAVRFAAIHHKSHTVLCNKGLKHSSDKKVFRLASYRHLSEKAKIQLIHESMLADPMLTTIKVCIRLSPSLEQKYFSNANQDYIRDEVRKAILKILPIEQVLVYLVKEISPGVPPHFHGALAIPSYLLSDETLKLITESIRRRAPFRHYRQYWNSSAVDIGATYKRNRGTGEEKPVGSGCASYALKHAPKNVQWVCSAELRKKAKEFYDSIQSKTL